MAKQTSTFWDFKSGARLHKQFLGAVSFLAILALLPIAMLAINVNTESRKQAASAPIPPTPTPIPNTAGILNWSAGRSRLTADHVELTIDNHTYTINTNDLQVVANTDTLPESTALAGTWHENNTRVALAFLFKNNGSQWWVDQIFVYIEDTQTEVIFDKNIFKKDLGQDYTNRRIRLVSTNPRKAATLTMQNVTAQGFIDPLPICGTPSIPPASGPAPLTTTLHGAGSAGLYGIVGYQWDVDGNRTWDTAGRNANLDPIQHTYKRRGNFTPRFRVKDTKGNWSPTCTYPYTINVGATTPPSPPPTNYSLRPEPQSSIYLPVQPPNEGYGLNAVLTTTDGTTVIRDQSKITYQWTNSNPEVVSMDIEPTGSFNGSCPYNISDPCPNMHARLRGLSPGTSSINVTAIHADYGPITATGYAVTVSSTASPSPSSTTTTNPADFNHDGVVNLLDYDTFLAAFLSSLNNNGAMTLADYDIFLTNFINALNN